MSWPMNLFRKQASEKEKREFEQFQRGLLFARLRERGLSNEDIEKMVQGRKQRGQPPLNLGDADRMVDAGAEGEEISARIVDDFPMQVEARLDSEVATRSSEPMSSRSLFMSTAMTYSMAAFRSNADPGWTSRPQPPQPPQPPPPMTKQRVMELALGMGLKVVDTDPAVPGEDTTGPIVVKGKRRFEPA